MFTGLSAGAPEGNANLETSDARVGVGERVTLRGEFPGTVEAPFEIRYRENGEQRWETVARGETGASGRYRVSVRPRRSGYWRAQLSLSGSQPVDRGTASERISVRSKVKARVSSHNALVGRSLKIHGTVSPAGAERRVVVRVGDSEQTVRAGRDGTFSLRWRAPATGSYPVRVAARPNRLATGSRDSAGRVTVYRPAAASWYGPGLYGNNLGCGGTLTPSTIGVAHKTLPCGTKLRIRYRGRSVDVRVIDRGPYSGDREFDLTSATKQRLGFPDVGTVLTSR